MLCEAEIGYICDFIIYTGNSTVFNELYTNYELSTKVVKHLLNRFLGNGYYVTVDNYYMSPELVDLLIAQKADIYGRKIMLHKKRFTTATLSGIRLKRICSGYKTLNFLCT
ncbi:piggyBac transposable element-derived protein 4 [Nephila pilipes]|uniref:PiggyBac transposable element-derived protein 4 n=1 Tax=Nephila pilipes TaxID=299642 RepID=A0A8X6NKP4_NEPPI|nr:piggyBac transposable element-derived protein 4 [Nephila pilipes]